MEIMKTLRGVSFLVVSIVVFNLFASVVLIEAKTFCMPKNGVEDSQLQKNLDWACGQGTDCSPIQPGAICGDPPNVRSRAAFAMNSYYRNKGGIDGACDFNSTGQITTIDPSYGNCTYI